METGGGPRLRSPGEEHSPDAGGASGGCSLKRHPELGSEASCPEAFREERLPAWGQAAAGRVTQSRGAPPPRRPRAPGRTRLPGAPPGGCWTETLRERGGSLQGANLNSRALRHQP